MKDNRMKHTFAKSILAAALVSTMFTAPSMARPNVSEMGCGASNELIKSRGNVVMNIKPGVYRRFVAKRNMCGHGKRAFTYKAKTGGLLQCRLKYACRDDHRGGNSEHSSNNSSSNGGGNNDGGRPSGGGRPTGTTDTGGSQNCAVC